MINRSAILGLLPEHSFVRWLAGQDYDVYMIDWGEPVQDAGMRDMAGVIRDRLVPALAFAAGKAGPVHAMGYCMGGTLLAAGAIAAPETMRSVVFLASPWDFHAGDKILTSHIQAGTPSALQMIAEQGTLPANWIQSVFAVVNADRAVSEIRGVSRDGPEQRTGAPVRGAGGLAERRQSISRAVLRATASSAGTARTGRGRARGKPGGGRSIRRS